MEIVTEVNKSIIIFGFGDKGKKIVDQCLEYVQGINIIAIADNNPTEEQYRNICVVHPENISDFTYDEIWVCTIYYREIRNELITNYGIDEDKIFFEDVVMPVINERIRKKYIAPDYKTDNCDYPIEYIKNCKARMYSYPFYDEYLVKKTNIFFDDSCGLFYAYYCRKRMYLARIFNTEEKARFYVNQMLMEQDERCPHCYWQFDNMQNIQGKVVDVGAAEGIFGLRIIDQIEHLYMIEADEGWEEALKYTYRDYLHKITIIKKYVSDIDNQQNARLDTLFSPSEISAIKMDIEGMEIQALNGALNILKLGNPMLVICAYHKQSHASEIKELLEADGFMTKQSQGWVLCQGEWELDSDDTDFRKALIFAEKDNCNDIIDSYSKL